jgi:BlaI family penicillinase repressor
MKQLTKAEEEVMQHLWQQQKAFVKEIVAEFPEPKPAYNTVSTIVRILEKKGYVGFKSYGKSHQYFPLVTKDAYSKQSLSKMVSNYFEGSFKEMVSFFVKDENISVSELTEIQALLERKKSQLE